MRSILLLLIPALALAAPRKYRDEARDRTESAGVAFHLLGNGAGVSQIHTELDQLFPGEMVGNWFLLDGTRTAGPVALSPVGSPTTQTDSVCPNGPNCANVTSRRLDLSNYYSSSAAASPAGDVSVCALVRTDSVASRQMLVAKDSNVAGGRAFEFGIAPSSGLVYFIVYKADAASTQVGGVSGAAIPGAWHFICGTYDFVADGSSVGKMFLDGAQVGATVTTAVGPIQANTTAWQIGRRIYGGSENPLSGTIAAAFITEKVLDPTTIAAMASAVIPTVQGSRGEAVTTTRSTVRACCSGSSCTMLPANRACAQGATIDVSGSWTNLFQQSAALDTWGSNSASGCTYQKIVGPFGTQDAIRITGTGASPCSRGVGTTVSFTSGTAYTWTGWVRAGSLSALRVRSSGGAWNGCDLTTTTGGWDRLVCTKTASATGAFDVFYEFPTATAGTLDVADFQIETGSFAHPHCPTTTAAQTCNTDVVTVATPTGFNTGEGCAKLCLAPNWTGASPAAVFLLDGDPVSQNTRFFFLNGSNINSTFGASATPSLAANHVAGQTRCYLSEWSKAGNFVRMSNLTDGTSASNPYTATPPTLDTVIGVGGNKNGGLPLSWGRISDLQLGTSPGACR